MVGTVPFTRAHEAAIDKAHERVDAINNICVEMCTHSGYTREAIDNLKDDLKEMKSDLKKHQENEASEMEALEDKVEKLIRYKWLIAGGFAVLIFISNYLPAITQLSNHING